MGGLPGGRDTVNIDTVGGVAVSGKIPTTAAGGGSNVAVTNVSGDVRVTAGSLPIQVSVAGVTRVSGQIKVTSVGAGGAAVAITNVSGQIPVTAGGLPLPVTVAAQPIAVSIAAKNAIDVSAQGAALQVTAQGGSFAVSAQGGALAVNIVQTSAQIHVTAGGGPLTVSANQTVFISGQIKTTAVGAGGAAVAITNVSGEIRVTAGQLPVPVTVAAQPIAVSIAAKNAIDVSAQGAALQVTAQGGSFAVSAQGGVITVSVQNEPLVDVCGVNRTGSAMNVFLAGVSAEVHVTAGGLGLPVVASMSGDVRVTGGNLPIAVSIAANAAVAVSQNAPLAWETGARSDMVFNALVSNPVKFGKLAQVAGAVCADIVAAVASRRIRVLGGYFNSTSTATAIFMTTGASAALTPKIVINTGFVLPINPYGYFETAVGSALSLQIEGGSVGGFITYSEVF